MGVMGHSNISSPLLFPVECLPQHLSLLSAWKHGIWNIWNDLQVCNVGYLNPQGLWGPSLLISTGTMTSTHWHCNLLPSLSTSLELDSWWKSQFLSSTQSAHLHLFTTTILLEHYLMLDNIGFSAFSSKYNFLIYLEIGMQLCNLKTINEKFGSILLCYFHPSMKWEWTAPERLLQNNNVELSSHFNFISFGYEGILSAFPCICTWNLLTFMDW